MNQEIQHLCVTLKLYGFQEEYERQIGNIESREAPFDNRLLSLLLAEKHRKNSAKVQRLLKQAGFKQNANVAHINYRANRNLDKSSLQNLINLDWVRSHQNICLTGATGIGKTWLACALGYEACTQGIPTLFKKTNFVADELIVAKAQGELATYLNQLKKFPLLILDDWALDSYESEVQKLLFELIDERHNTHFTIITSLMPMEYWHDAFDNKNVAESMLDRLASNTHRINLKGDSLRAMS